MTPLTLRLAGVAARASIVGVMALSHIANGRSAGDVAPFFIDSRLATDPAAFRDVLLGWFAKNGRDLPWRRTRDPYAILVSELMLQQTQVATVIPFYERWLHRFPDLASLAAARESDVLHAWQGLGYYARARNLHAAAKAIVTQHGGVFPRDAAALQKLPGLGRYTANAVATFAFDLPVPIVEANTARLFARLLNLQERIDSGAGRHALWGLAGDLVPERDARSHNSALMDLGALVCVPGKPDCPRCPVRHFCRAEAPAKLPVKAPRPSLKRLTEDHHFSLNGGNIVLEQSHARWRGMWILPRRRNEPAQSRVLYSADFPFTQHRITLRVSEAPPRYRIGHGQRAFPVHELAGIPMPSPHRRALEALLRARELSVGR